MSTHSKIRSSLYDYVRGELPDANRKEVDEHLHVCQRCRSDVSMLREFVEATVAQAHQPSDERTLEYWNDFATAVEQRIAATERRGAKSPLTLLEEIVSFVTLRWRSMLAYSGAVAAIVLAIVVWRLTPSSTPQHTERVVEPSPQQSIPIETTSHDQQINDYFRKSRMLLVGISNMDVSERDPIDLSTERQVSRQLISEARSLRQRPIDVRSAQLINDLEKILIELANTDEREDIPNVEIIRSGIRHENLLFKIRMAEAQHTAAVYQAVKNDH